jgi:hypothetical protein
LEEAEAHIYTPEEEAARNANKDRFVIGNINDVAHQLGQMAKASLVDEIMIADFYPSQRSRLKGYQLLAEEFDLISK